MPRTELANITTSQCNSSPLSQCNSSPLSQTAGYSNGGGCVFGLSGCRVRACKREDHSLQLAAFSAA